MKYLYTLILAILFIFINNLHAYTQEPASSSFSPKLFKKINERAEGFNDKLTKQSDKYLVAMAKEERKLKNKLYHIDSAAAGRIFAKDQGQYTVLLQKIKNVSGNIPNQHRQYLPHLDSLQTALKFLDKAKGLIGNDRQVILLLKQSLGNVGLLHERFTQAENVAQFMKQRRKFLEDQLGAFGLTKDLKNLQKQVYYYRAQVEEYKQQFSDLSAIEAKALAILKNTTLFKSFFKEHSQLAGLFRLPETASGNTIAGFASFETRESIEQQLLAKFGSIPDMQQAAAKQGREGQSQLNELKNKIMKSAIGNDESAMPDFKPNNQKAKSFLKRLELGTNLQTVKSNNFFPSTSDIAVSVGYKLNDKSIVGIGSSYKMGWGKDIRNISISHQGVGLRSFVDVKLKGSFWLSGGAEMNYRSQFSNFEILDDYSPWQKSALLGLSKKYRVSNKVKGNMQLMYDFLTKQQVPRTQAVIFRIGYVW